MCCWYNLCKYCLNTSVLAWLACHHQCTPQYKFSIYWFPPSRSYRSHWCDCGRSRSHEISRLLIIWMFSVTVAHNINISCQNDPPSICSFPSKHYHYCSAASNLIHLLVLLLLKTVYCPSSTQQH